MHTSIPAKRKKPVNAGAEGRQRVLDTAAHLFRTTGYASTSMRDIASAAGMRAASLYHHFDSKDTIVLEVLRVGVEQVYTHVQTTVSRLPQNTCARVVLQTAIHAHLHSMLKMQDYTSANVRIFAQVAPHVRQAHLSTRRSYEQYWAALLARCARQGAFDTRRDLRLTRLFLITAMNGMLEWFKGGRAALKALADELTDLLLQGLLVRPDAARCIPATTRGNHSKQHHDSTHPLRPDT